MLIDLRSDTVTKPTKPMLAAMMSAPVGDDVYGEDPSVIALEEYAVDIMHKEAALFVPSGTMSNQLALKAHTQPGDEIIVEKDAHIFYFETGAPSIISNVQMHTIPSVQGEMPLAYIEDAIRPDVYYFPQTKLICIENTHNRHGGSVISAEYVESVKAIADHYNIATHLDGARIWNACIASKHHVYEYTRHFDTVSMCLSKGLGAPVGSLLLGDSEKIKIAKKWRKILGGGMRQAGILAAAGLYALKNNIERLAEDHEHAKMFAKEIAQIDSLTVDVDAVQTNMVMINTDIAAKDFASKCKEKGLLFNAIGKNKARIVFHLDITRKDTRNAVDIVKKVAKEMSK